MFHKNVQRLTFTFIAYPGFLFALGNHWMGGLVMKCWGRKAQGLVGKLGHALAFALKVFAVIGLLAAAMWSDRWEKDLPQLAPVYDFTLQGMAYLSAGMVFGAKCLGLLSHGPETRRFVHKTTLTETVFEAALQLSLPSGLSLASGNWSTASLLSATSSLFLIGKTCGLRTSGAGISTNCREPPSWAKSALPRRFFLFLRNYLRRILGRKIFAQIIAQSFGDKKFAEKIVQIKAKIFFGSYLGHFLC